MVRRVVQAAFKFQPFSKKQLQVLTWWLPNSPVKDHDGIIADGAIRSGKTLSMSLSFVMWAMTVFDGQNFAMCGKTILSFRRNVVFWLKLMLRARGYKVKDHRTDNMLLISKGKVANYFYIFGGKDEKSQDLIQGITLAGVFFDEVALMPESFVNQATGRCSVDGSKFWFNCNPGPPKHWFKVEWIDRIAEKKLIYLHFTQDDNLSLSEAVKERYRAMYVGVFFQRYILGLWVIAEGLIYPDFANALLQEDNPFLLSKEELPKQWLAISIGIDFGGTKSKHAMVANGITHGYQKVISLKSRRYEPGNTRDLEQQAVEFTQSVIVEFGPVTDVRVDNAEQVLKRGIEQAFTEAGIHVPVRDAVKGSINDRIFLTSSLMATGRYYYTADAMSVAEAHATAMWDGTKLDFTRLDDGSSDIDSEDAHEYSIERYTKALINLRRI